MFLKFVIWFLYPYIYLEYSGCWIKNKKLRPLFQLFVLISAYAILYSVSCFIGKLIIIYVVLSAGIEYIIEKFC